MKKVETNLMRTLSTKRACWISFLPQNGVNCLLYIILSVTTWRTLKFLRISSTVQLLIDQQLHSVFYHLRRFGDNIRVVNFGDTVGQHMLYSARQSNQENSNSKFASPMQPWNFKFNLVQVQLEEEPFANAPVDNYCKFYLLCFVRRIWPLLAQVWLLCSLDTNSHWLDSLSLKCRP